MERLSIARALRFALLGLAIALTVIAALGIAGLFHARQRYEDDLARTYAVDVASARLGEAAATLRAAGVTRGGTARTAAAANFADGATGARAAARNDPESARLVGRRIAAERRLDKLARHGGSSGETAAAAAGARQLAVDLSARQTERRHAARERSASDTRRAVLIVGIAGAIALAAALGLVLALIASIRRPLDALVSATGRLAAGDLSQRVEVQGPRELRELGEAFNAMAEDLSRLEQLKSEFVATASHELRSPLTSIKGFVELLARMGGLTSKQREWVDVIELSTNRLVDLVNDLLDVTRIEAGRMEIHRRPTDLGEVVREVAALMGPRLEDRRQRLELDVPAGLPPANADPSRMRQVLTNLMTNAHLYTGDGGTLSVSVRSDGAELLMAVSDTGRGMSKEELRHVFDRFYRVRDSASDAPGTGLGLAIVKSLVDLHGGSVEVRSTAGEGTTFEVRVPREPEPDGRPAPRDTLEGKRVLVVDDEPQIARLIAAQLEPFGVETVVSESGEQAIERLRNDRFDAMTLDILMPRMSGFEVLHEMRADPALAGVPVVVVSVLTGQEALADEWTVSKPIQPLELADALGSAIVTGRTRVLLVGRDAMRERLEPQLDGLGLEHDWASSGATAARLCEQHRFEVALVDAGMRSPQAALKALDLRGRRLGRAVIVVSAGDESPALALLDADRVPVEQAAEAVLEALATRGRDTLP